LNPTLIALIETLYAQGLTGDAILAHLLIDAGVPGADLPRMMNKGQRQVYRYLSAVRHVTVTSDTYIQYNDTVQYAPDNRMGVKREGDTYTTLAEEVSELIPDSNVEEIAEAIASTDKPSRVDLRTLAERVLNAARSTFNAVVRKTVLTTPLRLFAGALRRMHERETSRVAYVHQRSEKDTRKQPVRKSAGPFWRSDTPAQYDENVFKKFD
jgi:hypothetical protein